MKLDKHCKEYVKYKIKMAWQILGLPIVVLGGLASFTYGFGVFIDYVNNASLDPVTVKTKYLDKTIEYKEHGIWTGGAFNELTIYDGKGKIRLVDDIGGINSISRNINDKDFYRKKAAIDDIIFSDGGVSFRDRSTIEYEDGFWIVKEQWHKNQFAKYDSMYNAVQETIKKELEGRNKK